MKGLLRNNFYAVRSSARGEYLCLKSGASYRREWRKV